MARPCYGVDLEAIAANWRALDGLSARDCRTAAVLKANAYGCGAEFVAPRLAREGVETFFVATDGEGEALRRILGQGPEIFVLNGFPGSGPEPDQRSAQLRPVVSSLEQLRAAAASPGQQIALQLDTGMNRLGLEPAELGPALDMIEGLRVELLMSHLHSADDPSAPANAAQLAAFTEMCATIRARLGTEIRTSLAATGGILLGKDWHFDLTRPGVGLFGGLPFADAQRVLTIHAPIIQIRDVAPGEAVGYGGSWVAERPSRIATIPVGYADGLPRTLSNRGSCWLDGQRLPMVGRVSMDLITLDVTDCPGAHFGSFVEIVGQHQSIDALAADADTIGYEILTGIGPRYQRIGGNTPPG